MDKSFHAGPRPKAKSRLEKGNTHAPSMVFPLLGASLPLTIVDINKVLKQKTAHQPGHPDFDDASEWEAKFRSLPKRKVSREFAIAGFGQTGPGRQCTPEGP